MDGKFDNFITRMENELDALFDKMTKLSDFMDGTVYDSLPALSKNLLGAQHAAMFAYHEILSLRLKLAVEKDSENER